MCFIITSGSEVEELEIFIVSHTEFYIRHKLKNKPIYETEVVIPNVVGSVQEVVTNIDKFNSYIKQGSSKLSKLTDEYKVDPEIHMDILLEHSSTCTIYKIPYKKPSLIKFVVSSLNYLLNLVGKCRHNITIHCIDYNIVDLLVSKHKYKVMCSTSDVSRLTMMKLMSPHRWYSVKYTHNDELQIFFDSIL